MKSKRKNLNILIRTAGGKETKQELGLGHIYRCLNLAKELKPNKINFLLEDFGEAKKIIEERGFKNIKTPLFPGYIFVSTNSLNKTWHKINYTRGVKSIVSFGNNISPIDKNFVDDLKKTEVNGRICFFKIKKLRIGDSCKITGGIFKNYFCFINKMCPKDRVKVLLKFLGREINCMVSRNILEPSFSA